MTMLDLHADHTSAGTMRANQLRLWFAPMAYVLICALIRISVRRVRIAMASACPAADAWGHAARRLADAAKARAAPI